ncbi:MAG TPA: FAD/NAD(P)-binding protein [Blastocatellia bacterium]|jgi:NAD(P)H-flavin reductase
MTVGTIDPMLPAPWRVRRVRRDTRDTFTLDLEPVSSGGIQFLPGQFNMLYVFGAGEVPISMSGDPLKSGVMTHTVRAVGVVTKAMSKLKRGDEIGMRGPFGASWPVEEAAGKDVVIIAGGIGLAPLRPVIYHVLAQREKYGRVALLYGTRTPGDMLYQRELEKWRGRFDLQVEATVDNVPAWQSWRGHVGVVTSLIRGADFDPAQTVAMICGPEVMMRFTAIELRKRGVGEENIFISMERNMKCAVGFCGHCMFGPTFICKDGAVFRFDRVGPWLSKREI